MLLEEICLYVILSVFSIEHGQWTSYMMIYLKFNEADLFVCVMVKHNGSWKRRGSTSGTLLIKQVDASTLSQINGAVLRHTWFIILVSKTF